LETGAVVRVEKRRSSCLSSCIVEETRSGLRGFGLCLWFNGVVTEGLCKGKGFFGGTVGQYLMLIVGSLNLSARRRCPCLRFITTTLSVSFCLIQVDLGSKLSLILIGEILKCQARRLLAVGHFNILT
jgi:hypothetical protein